MITEKIDACILLLALLLRILLVYFFRFFGNQENQFGMITKFVKKFSREQSHEWTSHNTPTHV